MEKPKQKLEKTSGSQSDDMEVESHSSKKDGHKRKAVIVLHQMNGSLQDPYSKVADADELKESRLASRGASFEMALMMRSSTCNLSHAVSNSN
ncbi:hypothetical protein SASPL_130547 [Salvia splendens]|uniref:Uncharacterized protein n=1 Tax=Salvia splendens TaxID=180675 RepID=A0A8X8X8E0_SALSN|nr:hypothetical protein SASPL_130547 [Salvia splendens]